MEPTTTTPAATVWAALRAWLEEPAPGAPGMCRAQKYKLKTVLAQVGASSPVVRYLTRQQHRGQDAQPPTAAQLQNVLPVFAADGFRPENENGQDASTPAVLPNQTTNQYPNN